MTTYIKFISEDDIEQVVKVHNNAFKGFFLTELGSSFLSVYYQGVANAPDGLLIGAFSGDRLIGFCAACVECSGFNIRLIKRNLFKISLIAFKLLFTRLKALIRLYKNLTKKGSEVDDGHYSEILSIAVDKNAQNCGAGKAMINLLEEALRKKGIKKLSLTTDFDDNENTIAFYAKRGFKPMYEFITYPNRKMYRLIKEL